jgi:hypothetical protein
LRFSSAPDVLLVKAELQFERGGGFAALRLVASFIVETNPQLA